MQCDHGGSVISCGGRRADGWGFNWITDKNGNAIRVNDVPLKKSPYQSCSIRGNIATEISGVLKILPLQGGYTITTKDETVTTYRFYKPEL